MNPRPGNLCARAGVSEWQLRKGRKERIFLEILLKLFWNEAVYLPS